ncbi:MAG: hypothetical protein ACOCP8_00750 [archaeon]
MKRLLNKISKNELDELIKDCSDFTNWVEPDNESLQLEYNVEYQHHIRFEYGEIWPTFEDFKDSINKGQIITLSKNDDLNINNRSHTLNMEELINLVSSYRSWPEFRNEDTVKDIIVGFKEDKEMTMPIIIEDKGYKQIMSGNTRLDIAFMMNVKPKIILVQIPNIE